MISQKYFEKIQNCRFDFIPTLDVRWMFNIRLRYRLDRFIWSDPARRRMSYTQNLIKRPIESKESIGYWRSNRVADWINFFEFDRALNRTLNIRQADHEANWINLFDLTTCLIGLIFLDLIFDTSQIENIQFDPTKFTRLFNKYYIFLIFPSETSQFKQIHKCLIKLKISEKQTWKKNICLLSWLNCYQKTIYTIFRN